MWRVRQPKLAKSILTFPHISTAFVNPSLPAQLTQIPRLLPPSFEYQLSNSENY